MNEVFTTAGVDKTLHVCGEFQVGRGGMYDDQMEAK